MGISWGQLVAVFLLIHGYVFFWVLLTRPKRAQISMLPLLLWYLARDERYYTAEEIRDTCDGDFQSLLYLPTVRETLQTYAEAGMVLCRDRITNPKGDVVKEYRLIDYGKATVSVLFDVRTKRS